MVVLGGGGGDAIDYIAVLDRDFVRDFFEEPVDGRSGESICSAGTMQNDMRRFGPSPTCEYFLDAVEFFR